MNKVFLMLLFLSTFVMQGCGAPRKEEKTVLPIPQSCGVYNIVYGSVNAHNFFFTPNHQRVDIFGIDLTHYTNKTLLIYGKEWVQTIGGLGEDSSSHTNINFSDAKIIQVVENGEIDREKLLHLCVTLKQKEKE